MLNLAAFRYRDILAEFGGPIDHISAAPVTIFGRPAVQANAYLADGLVAKRARGNLYGSADGTGTHAAAQVARFTAISEALERWAFYAEHRGAKAAHYGFDVDPSSNGMAAFPGFGSRAARQRARLEALERFALVSWWDGRIDGSFVTSPIRDVHVLRLHHPADFGEVVIVFRAAPTGHVSYGHAAARSLAQAIDRAIIELARTDFVLAYHKLRGESAVVSDFCERRCLHFASPAGHQEFLDRAFRRPDKPSPAWKPVFDGEIPGPWSRYATVWRTTVEMPTLRFLDRSQTFFFW